MARPETFTEIAFTSGVADSTPLWEDVTTYVRHASGIGIDHWRGDEDDQCQPSRTGFTLANDDGRFTPGNASGAHYPNIKKGRRVRERSTFDGNHVPNPSFETDTTGWSTNAGTIARVTTQFDHGAASLRQTAPGGGGTTNAFTTTGTGGFEAIARRTYTAQCKSKAAVTGRSFNVSLIWYDQAGAQISVSTGTTVANNTSTWTQATVTATAPATAATAAVYVQWLSTAGSEQHYLDTVQVNHGSTASTFTTTALTWYPRFTGYVDDFAVTWPGKVSTFADCTVTATSRMALLGRKKEMRSIVEQEYLRDSPTAYYTLGEPEGSTQASDTSGSGQPNLQMAGSGTAVVFGTATGPGTDGLTAATFAGGKCLQASIPTLTPAAVTVECFFSTTWSHASLANYFVHVIGPNTSGPHVVTLGVLSTGTLRAIVASGGVTVLLDSPGVVNDGLVHHAAVTTTSGGTSRLYLDGVEVDSDATAVTLDPITLITLGDQGNALGGGAMLNGSLAHVAITQSALTAARIADHATSGSTGFTNETVAARLTRYAAFAGVPTAEQSFETGDVSNLAHIDTTGKTALGAMRDVETTEGGVLFDALNGTLTFHDRSHRYGAASAFTVSYSGGDVANGLSPVLDDRQQVNDLTVTGSSGIAGRAFGQSSIDNHGFYGESLELATSNQDEPASRANWVVVRYAEPSTRVSEIEILLNSADATLTAGVLSAQVGTKFTLSGLPSNAPASSMLLFVEGISEAITADEYRVTIRTSPADVWDVWILDDATYSVLGTTTKLAY